MHPLVFVVSLLLTQPAPRPLTHDEVLTPASIGRPITYRVLLPEGYSQSGRRYPVLYLLHGLDGHFDDWSTRTHLAERARHVPVVIVMPEGGDSWYVNAADGSGRFEDVIATDLPADVEKKYRVIRARYGRAIAGLSMGGYGAIRIALRHPGTFAAAGSLSGAFDAPVPEFASSFPRHTEEMGRLFGPEAGDVRKAADVYAAAEAVTPSSGPLLYVDCGTRDRFLLSNRRLAEILQRRGLTYEYHETPGDHAWDFWDRRLDVLLPWVMRAFAKSAAGP